MKVGFKIKYTIVRQYLWSLRTIRPLSSPDWSGNCTSDTFFAHVENVRNESNSRTTFILKADKQRSECTWLRNCHVSHKGKNNIRKYEITIKKCAIMVDFYIEVK